MANHEPLPTDASLRPPHFYGSHEDVFEVTLHEPRLRRLPEALVHDIWHRQRFDVSTCTTHAGEPLAIYHPGHPNTDSGPDFLGAHLRIGAEDVHGDVEIHGTSGTWTAHKHHLDGGYNNVILHVALHADMWTGTLRRADGVLLPEVTLYPYLGTPLRRLLYEFYTRPRQAIPCAQTWGTTPSEVRDAWINTLALARIRAKTQRLAAAYLHTPDLETLLHQRLFSGLGYAKNAAAMATLASHLPWSFVRRIEGALDLEALHLGVAGLLPTPADLVACDRASADYLMNLSDRFLRLRLLHELPIMETQAWRFFRLRPANFPALRIVQGAGWFQRGGLLQHDPLGRLVEAFLSEAPLLALIALLQTTPAPFWETHVRLLKKTKPRNPSLGASRRHALLTNAIAPVMLLHAEQTGSPLLEAAVMALLRLLPPGNDEITRRFEALGTPPGDALRAQGLHHLYRIYCEEGRCLSCAVGTFLLDRGSSPDL